MTNPKIGGRVAMKSQLPFEDEVQLARAILLQRIHRLVAVQTFHEDAARQRGLLPPSKAGYRKFRYICLNYTILRAITRRYAQHFLEQKHPEETKVNPTHTSVT